MSPAHRYEHGPTACAAKPAVRRSIEREIRHAHVLSRGDARAAVAMQLVSANSLRRPGMNDAIFYPPAEAPAPARALAPLRRLARKPLPKTLHALALLVDFSDNPGTRPVADFERLLFDPSNPRSMTSYYRELSYGQLTVTGDVTNYIRAPKPYDFYTAGKSGTGDAYPSNTPGLLFDALTEFCKNDDLKRFDVDGDGYVDGLFLIHAGGGAEAEADPARRRHMIWSHKWTLPSPFEDQGVRVYAYSTEPEDGRLGVFAHEFGHVLGLPDLYDASYRSQGIGDWCLMAGGEWGGDGDQPTRMSAWCLARLGWIKPRLVRQSGPLTVKPIADQKSECHRVWTKGASGLEYLLLENRRRSGLDVSIPGSGLTIWHVDETQPSNDNPASYMVALVQADGRRDLERNANSGDAGDVFPGSSHVTSVSDTTNPWTRANGGSPSGVALSAIKNAGEDVTLRVKL